MTRPIPHALTLPIPPGFTPNAVRVEIIAWDEHGHPVLFEGVIQLDRLEGPLLRPDHEWSGYLALTTERRPLLEEDRAPAQGDTDDL